VLEAQTRLSSLHDQHIMQMIERFQTTFEQQDTSSVMLWNRLHDPQNFS
jgi:hypothetical protein